LLERAALYGRSMLDVDPDLAAPEHALLALQLPRILA
jgi:hypothetical protein